MIYVNGKEIRYKQDITLVDALSAAGEGADEMTLLVLDGSVLAFAQHALEPLEDGAKIQVLHIVSGG